VRRWIHRYNQDGTAGLADHPRSGRPRLGGRIRRLLAQPQAWTISRLWQQLGRPAMSQRTLHRRVHEVARWRRPRLVAKGDPDRDQVLAALHQQLRELPAGAVVLAEDETHINFVALGALDLDPDRAASAGDDAGEEPAADHLRRGRAGQRPVVLPDHPQGGQRQLHRLLRAAAGRLPDRTGGRGDL
jgi:hypothetical protein